MAWWRRAPAPVLAAVLAVPVPASAWEVIELDGAAAMALLHGTAVDGEQRGHPAGRAAVPGGADDGEPGGSWRAAAVDGGVPVHDPDPVPPVPEPVSVLMLAWGLLLIMPGGWLARWYRLGDRASLLQQKGP